jgi:hypothetical protein
MLNLALTHFPFILDKHITFEPSIFNIMTTEIIALLANLALALSFIVGLVFGISQVRAAARDRKERLTLETLRNFQTREFSELMNFVTNSDVPPTHEEWQKRPATSKLWLRNLHSKWNRWAFLLLNN